MLGFIKKDLLMIKSNIKILAILLLIYVVMAFQGQMDLSFLLPFMSVMIMMSTFSYDSYNKWDAYAISLPDGRKSSVKAKYLATIILIIATTIIITILSFTISYVKTKIIDFENIIGTIFGSLFATILLQSFIYPAMYKFGPEKARIGLMTIIFGIVIIGSFIMQYVDFSSIIKILNFIEAYWIIVFLIAMISMLYISYKISERIYFKKEV